MTQTKLCTQCKQIKSLSEFYANKRYGDGYKNHCKDCHRKWHLKDSYGITVEEYNTLLQQQQGVCYICGEKCKSGRRLSTDHCHVSGKVRGLLCYDCNSGIAKFNDKPSLLRNAAAYLDRFNPIEEET